MRIVFIIDRAEPFYRGGYETRVWELARRLAKEHDVTMLTSAPRDQILENVKIKAVRPQVAYFHENGFRDLRANLSYSLALLRYLARNERFDVVDCNATPFIHVFPAALLAKRWGAAFLVTAHEALSQTFHGYFKARGSPFYPGLFRVARKLYYLSQHLPKTLIAACAVTAENLQAEGFRSVAVCAGGVGSCRIPKTQFGGRFIFLGRLVRNKKVDILLKAFQLAADQNARVESLTIIGGGPERSYLEGLVQRLGIASRVRLLGELDDDRKGQVLRNEADVFISASVREGFSLATLEALASANPAIISHKVGGSQNGSTEYIQHGFNGLITDGEPDSLAAAMSQVANDSKLFARMSANAVITASAYTWDIVVAQLTAIYEKAQLTGKSASLYSDRAQLQGTGHHLRNG